MFWSHHSEDWYLLYYVYSLSGFVMDIVDFPMTSSCDAWDPKTSFLPVISKLMNFFPKHLHPRQPQRIESFQGGGGPAARGPRQADTWRHGKILLCRWHRRGPVGWVIMPCFWGTWVVDRWASTAFVQILFLDRCQFLVRVEKWAKRRCRKVCCRQVDISRTLAASVQTLLKYHSWKFTWLFVESFRGFLYHSRCM